MAAGALVAGSPGMALAALMRGHALRPPDPSFLVNAAGAVVGVFGAGWGSETAAAAVDGEPGREARERHDPHTGSSHSAYSGRAPRTTSK